MRGLDTGGQPAVTDRHRSDSVFDRPTKVATMKRQALPGTRFGITIHQLYFTEARMFRPLVGCWLVTLVFASCGGPVFTNLGNGVAVPSETIDALSREKGISRAQARALLRERSEQRKIADHAEAYGISLNEAKEQIERARDHAQREEENARPTLPN
jgi:hypothetical protein